MPPAIARRLLERPIASHVLLAGSSSSGFTGEAAHQVIRRSRARLAVFEVGSRLDLHLRRYLSHYGPLLGEGFTMPDESCDAHETDSMMHYISATATK